MSRCYSVTSCSSNRWRSEEHTSELQSRPPLVCRLLLEKTKRSRRRDGVRQHRTIRPPRREGKPDALTHNGDGRQMDANGFSLTAEVRNCGFFFNDTATTEIYTLSLHDALPI